MISNKCRGPFEGTWTTGWEPLQQRCTESWTPHKHIYILALWRLAGVSHRDAFRLCKLRLSVVGAAAWCIACLVIVQRDEQTLQLTSHYTVKEVELISSWRWQQLADLPPPVRVQDEMWLQLNSPNKLDPTSVFLPAVIRNKVVGHLDVQWSIRMMILVWSEKVKEATECCWKDVVHISNLYFCYTHFHSATSVSVSGFLHFPEGLGEDSVT